MKTIYYRAAFEIDAVTVI